MELRPGIVLGVMPRFQSAHPWSDRLQINGGVETDGRHVFARRDWRALGSGELAVLTDAAPAGLAGVTAGLLSIPPHVRAVWWTLAERAGVALGRLDGYDAFAAEIVDFIRFKTVSLPGRCRFDVVASRPAQPSTRWDAAAGCPGGLGFSASAPDETGTVDRVVAVINLGDEATHLVLLNLPPLELTALLDDPVPEAPANPDLVAHFFRALPTYPLIRLRLDPGDGLWLPECGLIYDGCTHGKVDVDVVLTIHDTGPSPKED